jgi:uncharacterized protein with WD repeat
MKHFHSLGLYQFNIFGLNAKYEAALFLGSFSTTIFEEDFKYSVYSLSYFWVEIKFQKNTNRLLSINAFVSGDTLSKYSPDLSFILD